MKIIKGEEFPQYSGDSPNVFLELKLVPAMKKEILKTDIHERNANPNLNEVFEFGLPYDVVKQQNLSFTLMYMDKFSHPFPVGEVAHHLDHLEMVGAGTVREEMIVCREIQRLQQVRGLLTLTTLTRKHKRRNFNVIIIFSISLREYKRLVKQIPLREMIRARYSKTVNEKEEKILQQVAVARCKRYGKA